SLSLAFDINLGGTRKVAEAIRLTDVRRVVQISTFGVYASRVTPTEPITEDFPRGGVRGYGNLKIGKEALLEAYAHEYKRELFMLRPANVYGFGHFFAGSSGGQKMQALLEAGLKGSTASIPSSETMSNEYVYADDVGRAIDLAATVEAGSHRTFNIGNGVITPFDELIATVKKIAPLLKYHIEPGAAPSSKAFPLDICRAEASLRWKPRFSLAEGFADFRDEVEKARSAGY
ncbi:MAG: NAD(P)-dependent oxidoreductase, partial [Rhizobium sp.]|nr:NAD(P)-dependent oxidoreductase [Rhizobium sp.]